jgi:ribosomal protein L11 methyltransferase
MTKWMQVTIDADVEAVEPVSDLLSQHVYGGISIEQNATGIIDGNVESPRFASSARITGYLPIDDQLSNKRANIEVAVSLLSQLRPIGAVQWLEVDEEDWANAWKQHYHTLRVGQHIVIKPSWEAWEPEPEDILVELDPGMAFGTGLHPTTQLCLGAVERYTKPGMRVLDLGTGSGILSIAAIRLGADSVLAIDNDSVAVKAAAENIARNGLSDRIQTQHGSLDPNETPNQLHEPLERFDLITANIVAGVLTMLAQPLSNHLKDDGILLASGIINERLEMVTQAFQKAGLRITATDQMGDWFALVCMR